MAFNIFTKLSNYYHYLILAHFNYPGKKHCSHQHSLSISPSTASALAGISLFSVSTDLPILNISHKQNCTVCGLLRLFSHTQHSVCIMYQYCVPFCCQMILHCMDMLILFIHSSVYGHLGCFHFWAIMNNATMNIHVQVFVWTYVFISLRYKHRNRISGSYVN